MGDMIGITSPEEAELKAKKEELTSLSETLSQRELDLEEMRLALARFQHRYFKELGRKYMELDEIRVQIAALKARRTPHDDATQAEAVRAKRRAEDTSQAYRGIRSDSEDESVGEKPPATTEAKRLYKKVASAIHPDRATDEDSIRRRTRLMAELNKAYAEHNLARMRSILEEWQRSPESVVGDGVAAELVRVIRAIAQVRERIRQIEIEMGSLMSTDMHKLMTAVHAADQTGRDMLEETAAMVDMLIGAARRTLADLQTE